MSISWSTRFGAVWVVSGVPGGVRGRSDGGGGDGGGGGAERGTEILEEAARDVRHEVDQLVELQAACGPQLRAPGRRDGGRWRRGVARGVEAL